MCLYLFHFYTCTIAYTQASCFGRVFSQVLGVFHVLFFLWISLSSGASGRRFYNEMLALGWYKSAAVSTGTGIQRCIVQYRQGGRGGGNLDLFSLP